MENSSIFSVPISRRRQNSMRHRFIIFSSVLFLFIFIVGSAAFIILLREILHRNIEHILTRTVEIERLKLEAAVNSEIAVVLKMASSPVILQYFLNPADSEMERIALEDIEGYRQIFSSHSIFFVKDTDKKFFHDNEYGYTVDPDDPENYWYNRTMYETEKYNFNINYNPSLGTTNLWINAPVFDKHNEPVGIVGTGMNISDHVDAIYQSYSGRSRSFGSAELFFFNAAGEITGADNINLVADKVNITDELGSTGERIFAAAKGTRSNEIKYAQTNDQESVFAFGSIPALDWYITVVSRFTLGDSLQTGMTVLFGVMMIVIFSVFVVFNIFMVGMLEPLNRMVKTIRQTLSDWELQPHGPGHKDEIGTLGEFFNMTIIDPLTGIYNRRYMDGHLKRIIKSLTRTNSPLSLLLIDIDYFKKYNDTYGHDGGDNCLRMVAQALSQCIVREEDFVARYGGEEFVVILPNTDEAGAQLMAHKLLQKIQDCSIPHESSGVAPYVTISIGGTTDIVNQSQYENDYIKRADKALYESKKNGRNRYTEWNEAEGDSQAAPA